MRLSSIFRILNYGALLATFGHGAALAQLSNWTFEDIAPFGVQSDIELDATGSPHILFVNCYWHGACQAADTSAARLRYAYHDGMNWVIEEVAQHAHGTPSVAIGPSGDIHTAFQHTAWLEIYYARRGMGGWAVEPLQHANPNYVKKHPSIALANDPDETPHIAFYEGESVEYTVRVGGVWQEEGVPGSWIEEWASMTPLVLDSQDEPHIGAKTYVPSNAIRYQKTSGNWSSETFDALQTGHNTTMTIDANDAVHMAYHGVGLTYATNASGSWTWETVDATAHFGWPGSIALDPAGNPFIGHLDANQALVLYYRTGTTWQQIPVDPDGLHPSIVIAPDGTIHLSYYDQTTETLRYGTHPHPDDVVGITDMPLSIALAVGSWPNPFNPTTTISYSIPQTGVVDLRIYDVRGQLVRILAAETKTGGEHRVAWNGKDGNGTRRASGVYFVRLHFDDETRVRRIVMLK